jgi:geranylgeranyl diphosphate synthase type I
MAFQIRDDVLGIWGTLDATGKISGNDIARRKWTFPVVWALAQPPSPARDRIAAAYARGETLDNAAVGAVVDALDEIGARDAADQAAAGHLAVVERHAVRQVREFLLSSLELAST